MTTKTSWKEKTTNEVLYQDLQSLSQTIRERRMRLAVHCIRHTTEMAHNFVLWEPTRGKRNRGRQTVTYINFLKEDTGLTNTDKIRTEMMARNEAEAEEYLPCHDISDLGLVYLQSHSHHFLLQQNL